MASGEAPSQPSGLPLDFNVYPSQPKRVSRACDYCRKKRIKCSAGQRPCMNCLLYRAVCTDSAPVATTAHKAKRQRQLASLVARQESRQPVHDQTLRILPGTASASPASARPTPTVVSLDDDRSVQQQPGPDEDPQIAPDLPPGEQDSTPEELLSSSDPWDPNQFVSNIFDFADSPGLPDWTGAILTDFGQMPSLHEPHERRPTRDADGGPAPSSTRHPKVAGVHFLKDGLLSGKFASLLPGLFLKKDAGESRYQGLNSIGATLSSCLIYARHHSPELGEQSLLQYLIQGITYMDEANTCPAPRIDAHELPDRALVEHGVELFFTSVYLRYPIVSLELRRGWTRWYDDPASAPDPIQFLCVCIMVAIGATAHPRGPTPEMRVQIAALHQRAWAQMDYVLAHPYTGAVQVILLHTVYFTQQGKLGIAWSTCGTALRMAASIGLHRHTPHDLQLSPELVRLRARLWWVAYSLDAFLSLCEGRPTGSSADQTDAKIESLSAAECPDDSERSPGPMIYAWNVTLAGLANRIADIISRERGAAERLRCLAELDVKLLAWRDAIPLEYRPDQENLASPPLRHHVAWLHVQFFNVCRTLHWTSMLLSHLRDDAVSAAVYPRLQSSEAICVASARSLIRTCNHRSTASDTTEMRQLGAPSVYFLAATATIFMHILKQPQQLSAAVDVEYLRAGIHHLTSEFFVTQVGQCQEILVQMLTVAEAVTKPARSIPNMFTF